MKFDSPKYSRRAVLKRLGVGAAFLPLLSTERARAASASTGYPLRFISVTYTDGVCPPNFYVPGSAGPLPATLPSTLQPLAAWSSKLILFKTAGKTQSPFDLSVLLDAGQKYSGHSSYPALLTGDCTMGKTTVANSPSIDQLMANDLATKGVTNAQLNVGCRPGGNHTSWRSSGVSNAPQTDPYKLFSSLFSGASMPATQVNALLQRRKSVLDYVGGELTSFSKNLGSDDKSNVEIHLQSIRDLETQLAGSSSSSSGSSSPVCTSPTAPSPTGLNFSDVNNYPNHVKFMSDIVAAAVICGRSRCVTMDLIDNGGGNSLTFPFINIPSPDMHAIAHQGSSNYAQKSQIDQWFYKNCVAEIVGKLAAVTEGNGTVLDNTVILVSTDMNEGSNHYVGSIPYAMIGGGGGYFKTGRLVTFPGQIPNNKLLTSILHAMGVMVPGVGPSKYAGDIDSSLQM